MRKYDVESLRHWFKDVGYGRKQGADKNGIMGLEEYPDAFAGRNPLRMFIETEVNGVSSFWVGKFNALKYIESVPEFEEEPSVSRIKKIIVFDRKYVILSKVTTRDNKVVSYYHRGFYERYFIDYILDTTRPSKLSLLPVICYSSSQSWTTEKQRRLLNAWRNRFPAWKKIALKEPPYEEF